MNFALVMQSLDATTKYTPSNFELLTTFNEDEMIATYQQKPFRIITTLFLYQKSTSSF